MLRRRGRRGRTLSTAGQGRVIQRVRIPPRKGWPTTGKRVLGGLAATLGFKCRTASRQAISRMVEGIEPRKRRDGKDDAVQGSEVNTDANDNGKNVSASPGSETMACLT